MQQVCQAKCVALSWLLSLSIELSLCVVCLLSLFVECVCCIQCVSCVESVSRIESVCHIEYVPYVESAVASSLSITLSLCHRGVYMSWSLSGIESAYCIKCVCHIESVCCVEVVTYVKYVCLSRCNCLSSLSTSLSVESVCSVCLPSLSVKSRLSVPLSLSP